MAMPQILAIIFLISHGIPSLASGSPTCSATNEGDACDAKETNVLPNVEMIDVNFTDVLGVHLLQKRSWQNTVDAKTGQASCTSKLLTAEDPRDFKGANAQQRDSTVHKGTASTNTLAKCLKTCCESPECKGFQFGKGQRANWCVVNKFVYRDDNPNWDYHEVIKEEEANPTGHIAVFATYYNTHTSKLEECVVNERTRFNGPEYGVPAEDAKYNHASDLAVNCCDAAGKGSRPGCKKAVSYSDAEKHCVDQGLKLCSAEQLKKGAGASTGCGTDSNMIWSSTPGKCGEKKIDEAGASSCAVVKDAGEAAKGVMDLTPGFAVGDCRDGPYNTKRGGEHGGACVKGRTGLPKDLPDLTKAGCIKACTDMNAAAIQLGHQTNSRKTNKPGGPDRLSNCMCWFNSRAKPTCPAGWVANGGWPKDAQDMAEGYTANDAGAQHSGSGMKKGIAYRHECGNIVCEAAPAQAATCAVEKDAGPAAKDIIDLTPGFLGGQCRDREFDGTSKDGYGGHCDKGRTGLASDLPDLTKAGCIKACIAMKAVAIGLSHQNIHRKTNKPGGPDRLAHCYCFFLSRAKPNCPPGFVAMGGDKDGSRSIEGLITEYFANHKNANRRKLGPNKIRYENNEECGKIVCEAAPTQAPTPAPTLAPMECPTGMTAVAALTTKGVESLGYCVDTDTSIPPSNNFQDIEKVCEARGATLCPSEAYNAAARQLAFDGCVLTPTDENGCWPQKMKLTWGVTSDACSGGHYIFNYANTANLNNGRPYPNYQLCTSTYKFSNRYFRCCRGRVQMPKTDLTCAANMTPVDGFCVDAIGQLPQSSSVDNVKEACTDRGLQLCSANQMMSVARYFDYLLPKGGYGHGNTGGWGIVCDRNGSGRIPRDCTGNGQHKIFQYQNTPQPINGICPNNVLVDAAARNNRYYRCCSDNGGCAGPTTTTTTAKATATAAPTPAPTTAPTPAPTTPAPTTATKIPISTPCSVCFTLTAGDVVCPKKSNYHLNDMLTDLSKKYMGLHDLKTMKVTGGCKITLYTKLNFKGEMKTYSAGSYNDVANKWKSLQISE